MRFCDFLHKSLGLLAREPAMPAIGKYLFLKGISLFFEHAQIR